jgi:hypothetical protein
MNTQLKTMKVDNAEIMIKEYNGKRVVTFKDVDLVHDRLEGTAKARFARHKESFINMEDYFKLSP